ncbi:MAG: HD domain-containing protein [Oscillospiraceae bacterium]|nr:HD domain-containing protein [Oscillospiraceae bacterium]
MKQLNYRRADSGHAVAWMELGLIAVGTVLNLSGAWLASKLNIPLFLDSVGTVLAAALGGYVPGIFVGFLTNTINGFSDYTNAYYAILNILIAVSAAFFAQKHCYRRFPQILLPVVSFALIGGGIGSVLTWFLYGEGFGEGISSQLAHQIYEVGIRSVFLAQLTADLAIDLLDKLFSVLIAAVVLFLLPQKVHDRYNAYGWKDRGKKKPHPESSIYRHFVSLKTKVILIVATATLVVAVAIGTISIIQYHNSFIQNEAEFGMNAARLAASYLDPDKVDLYLENGENESGYAETESNLQKIWNSYRNIEYLYVYRVMEDGCHVVFDLDTPELQGGEPGDVIPFDEAFSGHISALLAGEEIEPMVSNETFGWLLTVYLPVRDSQGECSCYVGIDISMSRLKSDEKVFIAKTLSLFLAFFVVLLTCGISLAEYHIVNPINAMAAAASEFAYNSEAAREETIERIKNLKISTGDEVENLYHSLDKTAEDTARYVAESQSKSEQIAKLQNGLIVVMADLVESRDKYTGAHVKNTAAYVRIIMEQMREEGIYSDQLTDEFMEDVTNSAPLHDIGKIKISDTILNKPGKLTDEEFKMMKYHTIMGAVILDSVIDTLLEEETGYLQEAKRLAEFHHEKWDGSGYPSGLAGEEIPLSARIMAVADVFDALVSKRSYKAGMSIEKAMDIITSGAGSHFDPKIVKAFVDAEDRIRAVAVQKGKQKPTAAETE